MARPFVPEHIHTLKGTAQTPRKRETVSAVAEGNRPICPRHLSRSARKAWNEVVRLLERRKTLDEAAGPTLLIYATTMARWLQAKADVDKNGMMVETTKQTSKGDLYTVSIENPMLGIQVDAEAQLLQITKSLGIDPSAREKVLPVKPTPKLGAKPTWLLAMEKEQANAEQQSGTSDS